MVKYVSSADADVGNRIKARRKELKMTQKQLADVAGCTFQQIQKYEVGHTRISVSIFLKICECLRTPPGYFLDRLMLCEQEETDCENLEERLLAIFRSIQNSKVKAKILNLVEAIVSDSEDLI
ncbi:MAG: helix-turn-helix domain-containing protein [Holosporales bacterium]|jgi:transcriptional regulator with XRE-family HTH domain|nr:helix-turn-helix domain-containing protein [Holosporales bacterium]